MSLQLEALSLADIDAFVALLRESLAPEHLEFTIYSCDGIANYIAYELQTPATLSKKYYFVLKDGAELLAAVVLRTMDAGLGLDYIATKARARSQGLARKLWQEATARIRDEAAQSIHLDVFRSNELALNWYRKLGFTEIARSAIWSCQPLDSNQAPAKLLNYPQAEAVQEKFGFSQLSLSAGKLEFTIGRLGNKWYRINKPAALSNPAVIACLCQLDPQRRILGFVPPDFEFSPALYYDWALEGENLSMQLKLDNSAFGKAEN